MLLRNFIIGCWVAFAVYWAAQTLEHWEGGVPTGAERATRAAAVRVRVGKHAARTGSTVD